MTENIAFAEDMSGAAVRQWEVLAADLLTRLNDSDVRAVLLRFTTAPVDEALPSELIDGLTAIKQPQLSNRAGKIALREHLARPFIPPEKMVPDIKHSPHLQDDEKDLAIRRFAQARDVKLLAFAAELVEIGGIDFGESNHSTLPSGIEVSLEHDQPIGLIDPANWSARVQLKDRVYTFSAGSRSYLLKEQKTAHHKDTLLAFGAEGATSAEEVETARQLRATTPAPFADVMLTFERPVGHVKFPDGFQFAVFEFEEGLISDYGQAIAAFEKAILANPEQFETEYNEIAEAALQYAPLFGPTPFGNPPLERPTFEEYVKAKAEHAFIMASELANRQVNQAGFFNRDNFGDVPLHYRVHNGSDGVRLEGVAFDFERFVPVGPELAAKHADLLDKAELEWRENKKRHLEFINSAERSKTAAHLALLDRYDPRDAFSHSDAK